MVKKLHAGSGIPHGHLNRGTDKKPSPLHGGTSHVKGQTHAPPRVGGAVNAGGTFSMGTLKKRK